MNLEHFRAFLWLRWRLRINQMRRGGIVSAVILGLLLVLVVLLGLVLFTGFLIAGAVGLRTAEPAAILYVWDGLVAFYLFFWVTGLIADLQRAEPLSLYKFLHLPVSPTGAFLINYLSSLFSVTLALFLAAAAGLSLGLVISRGPALLMQLPLLLAFVLAVTALTYQFQGWLASLMSNPRRRRTIVVVATALFLLVIQLPNLINLFRTRDGMPQGPPEHAAWFADQKAGLDRDRANGRLPPEEYTRRLGALEQQRKERADEARRRAEEETYASIRLANLLLPPGWLPLGASAAAEFRFLPGLLGTLGLGLIGAASLRRAYRTTLRLYTGQFTSGKVDTAVPQPAAPPVAAPAGAANPRLLERSLPGVSEQAAAIALGSFVSFLRAPEAKMLLLSPLFFAIFFGWMLFSGAVPTSTLTRPLMVFGGMAMVLYSTVQVSGNLFGFDRAGFRVFVLSPAPRREVLLGKNLAFAPVALGLGLLVLAAVEVVFPLRFGIPTRLDHLLAAPAMMLSMYLLFILLANWLSLLAPIPIAPGSFKPSNPRMIPLLFHLLFFFLFAVALVPALLPLAVEYAAEEMGWKIGVPIFLLLSLLECAGVVLLYRLVIGWQGQVLHAREQHILNVVTATKD